MAIANLFLALEVVLLDYEASDFYRGLTVFQLIGITRYFLCQIVTLLWFLIHLQTILCVPTKNGVVELGSTDLVSLLIQGLLHKLYNGS